MMAISSFMTKTAGKLTDNKMVLVENLPMNAKTFVWETFPHLSIAYAEKNNGYVVELNDGTVVYFDLFGFWYKVESNQGIFYSSLIPLKISSFFNTAFFDQRIIMVEKKQNGFEIELSNHYRFTVDRDGNLV